VATGASPVALLKRVGVALLAAPKRLALAIRRRRRRVRKSLRRARRMPQQRLLSALHARGLPVVLPYTAGSRALARMWSIPAIRRRHVDKFLARNPGHPLARVAGSADPADLERFLVSTYFTIWRLLALSSCSEETFRRHVRVQGLEHLEKAREAGRGVILAAAHHGAASMLPVAIPRLGIDVVFIASRDFANLAPSGIRFITREAGDRMLLKPLMAARKVLRTGACVLMLADGDQGDTGVEIPFLDGTQQFARGFASLAVATGAPALPVLCRPGTGGDFTVEFGEAFDPGDPAWPRERKLVHLVGQYARVLEDAFVEDPFLLRHEFCGFHDRGTWNADRVWGEAGARS
jgi:lauroyl/myristoyl acyltransferase